MKLYFLFLPVLLSLVAGEQQQNGLALGHSPSRRLSTPSACPSDYKNPALSSDIVIDGNTYHDWRDGGTHTYNTSNPYFLARLRNDNENVKGRAYAALDCDNQKLYVMVWVFASSGAIEYSARNGVRIDSQNFNTTSAGRSNRSWEMEIPLANITGDCQTDVRIVATIPNGRIRSRLLSLDLTCPNDCGGYGDPHLKTWKGDVYDFHGGCDLVFLKNLAFASMTGLEIHIRTTIRRDWSYISAAALRIGNDILEVQSGATYYLNGIEGAELPSSLAGFLVTMKAHGEKRHVFEVVLENGCEVFIKVYGDFLAVSVKNARKNFENSVGMMGSFQTGELVARDGETVIKDTNLFGFEWQVQEGDPVLFQKPEGPQYPQTCDMPETVSTATGRRLSEDSMVSLEDAEKACQFWPHEGRESCIYDVISTGDLKMAEAGAF